MRIDPTPERRRRHRVHVSATAVAFLDAIELGRFAVDNLSLTGALLTGDVGATVGDVITVMLTIEGQETLDLDARVVRVSRSRGCTKLAVDFDHSSWVTEDALREVLLEGHAPSAFPPPPSSELEIPGPWDLDDSDLAEILLTHR